MRDYGGTGHSEFFAKIRVSPVFDSVSSVFPCFAVFDQNLQSSSLDMILSIDL